MQDANHQPLSSNRQEREDHFRHGQWCATAAFSVMALVATTSRFETDSIQDESKEVQWVVSAMSVVMAVSAISTFAHYVFKENFVGTLVEGALSVLTVAVWAAALPFIMDPDYNLAVTRRYGSISNPILYFFSWAAFITSFFIMMGYLFQCYSSRCSDRRPAIFSCSASSHWLWVGLVLTSFVVMMTANRMVIEGHCCKVNKDSDLPRDWSDPTLPTKEVCDRLKVAVGLGTASAVLSFAWFLVNTFLVGSKNSILMCVDTVTVGLLLVLWTFGATWLTFNENKSPGADLCNLYFFTWGSWILALVMVMNSFHHIAAGMTSDAVCEAPVAEPTPGETKKDGGVPIGCLDDNQNADAATHATQDDKHADVEEAQT